MYVEDDTVCYLISMQCGDLSEKAQNGIYVSDNVYSGLQLFKAGSVCNERGHPGTGVPRRVPGGIELLIRGYGVKLS